MAYYDEHGEEISLAKLCLTEPGWAANRIAECEKDKRELEGIIADLKTREVTDLPTDYIELKD